jgi:hypothetical protein
MKIDQCRNCSSAQIEEVLDLGDQPPSNSFLDPSKADNIEASYPLGLVFCKDCTLLQLSFTVDPKEMFTDYVYVTSNTKPLVEHLQSMAKSLFKFADLQSSDLVADIGCNDGSLLKGYPEGEVKRLGIEPSSVAEIAKENGIPVHRGFFNAETAEQVAKEYGKAKVVTATNVYAHVSNQDDFLKGMDTFLRDDGMFVIEVPYVTDMLEKNLFDTIYHEHIFYYSLHSLENMLSARGFRIFHIEKYEFGPSGPPIRAFICKTKAPFEVTESVASLKKEELAKGLDRVDCYKEFSDRVWDLKSKLLNLMEDLKGKGNKILGFGAPAKGNTILNAFGLDTKWLDCILEKNSLKCGLLTPGTHIPVVDEDTFDSTSYDYALLLSWNLADFFLKKSPFIKRGGKFIVPLPNPTILP